MQMCTYAHVWIHAWYTAQTLRANCVENMSVTWFDVSRYAPKLPCPTLYCSTTCNTCCLTRQTGQLLWRVDTCCAAHCHCCGLLDMERSIWRMKYGFYSWDDTFICFGKANRSINLCSNQLNFLITTKDKDILLYMTTIEMTEWKLPSMCLSKPNIVYIWEGSDLRKIRIFGTWVVSNTHWVCSDMKIYAWSCTLSHSSWIFSCFWR